MLGKGLFRRYRLQDFLTTFVGRGVGGVLNLVFLMWAAKLLGTRLFGLFSLSIAVHQVALQFAGHGLDTVVVRFFVVRRREDPDAGGVVLRACFLLRLILTGATTVVGLAASWAYVEWSGREELWMPLMLGLVGCSVASVWYYLLAALQAAERFVAYSLLTFSANVVRLGVVALLSLVWVLGLEQLLVIHYAVFGLGAVAATALLSLSSFRGGSGTWQVGRDALRFGKWVVLDTIVYMMHTRMDTVSLSLWRTPEEVGVYGVAIALVSVLDLVVIVLWTVFLPRASKIRGRQDAIGYAKQVGAVCGGVAVLLLLGLGATEVVVEVVLGDAYARTATVFAIILPGLVLYLFAVPLSAVLIARDKPHLLFWGDVGILVLTAAGCVLLIPRFGIYGAAAVAATGRAVNAAIMGWFVQREIRRLE